jgi:translation initiation factor 1
MKNTRLVYSTDSGHICPKCRKPSSNCNCGKKWKKSPSQPPLEPDGIIRIRRETKGRKGKTVTAVFGFELGDSDLKALAKLLKRHCGSGGSVKDGVVVIQGDHREAVKGLLAAQGYKTKIAGG